MDYSQASSIRKKSLSSLIAEKKFGEGLGLGSSIGGAVSEKFKSKAVGIKEKLDPLNWVSALTGKGTFGKIATTLAGRAFGRGDESIEYFGGYGRSKKDPQRTNIGPGRVLPLRVGDSTADILAKMYNLTKITFEKDKTQKEIEVSFRKEQLEEDERRHKKLIDELLKLQKGEKPQQETDKTFIEKIMDGLKSTLGNILSIAKSGASVAFSLMKGIGGLVTSIMTSFAGSLVKQIVGTVIKSMGYVIGPLIKRMLLSALGGAVRISKNPVATVVLGAISAALVGGQIVDAVVNTQREMYGGDESRKLFEESDIAKEEADSLISSSRGNLDYTSPEIVDIMATYHEKRKLGIAKGKEYQEKFIKPAMEDAGFKLKKTEIGVSGLPIPVYEKDGKEATLEEIVSAIAARGVSEKISPEALKQMLEPFLKEFNESAKLEIENFQKGTNSKLVPTLKNDGVPPINDGQSVNVVPPSGSNTVVTNNVGGKSQVIDSNTPNARNDDESLKQCQRANAAKC